MTGLRVRASASGEQRAPPSQRREDRAQVGREDRLRQDVIDLMAALKKSVDTGSAKAPTRKAAAPKTPARKPAARKRA